MKDPLYCIYPMICVLGSPELLIQLVAFKKYLKIALSDEQVDGVKTFFL